MNSPCVLDRIQHKDACKSAHLQVRTLQPIKSPSSSCLRHCCCLSMVVHLGPRTTTQRAQNVIGNISVCKESLQVYCNGPNIVQHSLGITFRAERIKVADSAFMPSRSNPSHLRVFAFRLCLDGATSPCKLSGLTNDSIHSLCR